MEIFRKYLLNRETRVKTLDSWERYVRQQERQDQYSAISELRCSAQKDQNKHIDSCKTFCLPVNTWRQRESPTACQGPDLVNMVILFHSQVGGGGDYSQSMVCWPEKQ